MANILQKKNRFDLLLELIRTNFKLRYQNSILGVLWVVIKPYMTFIVLYLVWSNFGGAQIKNYGSYLLIGNIIFTFINELIVFGQMSLLERAGIILKVNFPRQIAVISALVSALINLAINMVLGFIILYANNIRFSFLDILYFLFIVSMIFIFFFGFSLLTSILTIRFRDLKNIFDLGLFMIFWLTPIAYTINNGIVGNSSSLLRKFITSSPFTIVIDQVRASLNIYGDKDYKTMIIYFIFSVLLLIFSWKFFQNAVKKVSEYF